MTNKQNAKYAFYYLLSLVALIFMSLSVGMILYAIINKTIVDALNNFVGNYDGQLKFAISALIIATPIYYLISRLINKGLRNGELEKDSGIRRWLTYFILLVSSLIVLGSFIGVINVFLSGELTSRFVLKALTVFLISAAVFVYYFYDIKRETVTQPDKVVKIFFFVSLALVLAAFIASWFFVESPATARARLLDQALVNNITSLESAVNNYYDRYKKLPDSLDSLKNDQNIYLDQKALVDPETKDAIIYQKLGDQGFELCATFRMDSAIDQGYNGPAMVSYPGDKNHRAGYQCLKGNLYTLSVKTVN